MIEQHVLAGTVSRVGNFGTVAILDNQIIRHVGNLRIFRVREKWLIEGFYLWCNGNDGHIHFLCIKC